MTGYIVLIGVAVAAGMAAAVVYYLDHHRKGTH
jgi:hypothetical protein